MLNYYKVKFEDHSSHICSCSKNIIISKDDKVIVKNDRYTDIGTAVLQLDITTKSDSSMPTIERIANSDELFRMKANQRKAIDVNQTAKDEIKKHKLEMKLIKTHITYDNNLIIFLFTADGRVDFRELVKSLSRSLSSRIELRQIGVRDETAIQGGIGTCGRSFCCSGFLTKFESINVKTAKDQGLPLNPATISGICNRLKCCLKYEHEGYIELHKSAPRMGSVFKTPEGDGKVIDINYLKQIIKVRLFEGQHKIVEVNLKTKQTGCPSCSSKGCSSKCKPRKK